MVATIRETRRLRSRIGSALRRMRRSPGSSIAARSCSDWLMELTTYLGSGLEISKRSDESINYHLHQQHTYIRQARKHTNKQPKLLACLPIYRPLLACLRKHKHASSLRNACLSNTLPPAIGAIAPCRQSLSCEQSSRRYSWKPPYGHSVQSYEGLREEERYREIRNMLSIQQILSRYRAEHA
jgi:hypothetical protein